MITHEQLFSGPVSVGDIAHWTRDDRILDDPSVNIRFSDLLLMSDDEVTVWIDHMRNRILHQWDEHGVPPLVGKTDEQMAGEFRKLAEAPGREVEQTDDDLVSVLMDNKHLGQAANQFFPSMMKTRIRNGSEDSGHSVYDLFAEPQFRRVMQVRCRRHFRRDSFYRYSPSVESNVGLIRASSGLDWIKRFARAAARMSEYGFWLNKESTNEASGYKPVGKLLSVSKEEIVRLLGAGVLPVAALVNVCPDILEVYHSAQHDLGSGAEAAIARMFARKIPEANYNIRLYDKSTRIFPIGFTAFKIGYSQVALNFPSAIAKYLYEKYTDHCKHESVLNIYDPSAGWGGRVVGAMTVRNDRYIHYIGTDPNPDNYLPSRGVTRYEDLAEFVNDAIHNKFSDPHKYEIFRLGSEVIGTDPRFALYEGKLDLVFTSPPYFAKEIYSEDASQSAVKFSSYPQWRDGFLRPTLETAYRYLRSNRYLLWNVADVRVEGQMHPLERDSKAILKGLGAEFVGVEALALANMPGANRVSEDGKPTCKNYRTMGGACRKVEPILVFRKP